MKLRWRSAPPTAPGFYWLRVRGEFEPEIVLVAEFDGALQLYICGVQGPQLLEGGAHEWYGPLACPP